MRYVGLLFALLLVPQAAHAQPQMAPNAHFVEGQTVVIRTMMCDTVDQLEAILRAQVEGGLRAGLQKYHALRATPNDRNEPTCLVAPYRLTLLDVAAEWDGVPSTDGGRTTVYILYALVNGNPYAVLSPIPVAPVGLDV